MKILLPTLLLIISNNIEAQTPTKKVDAKCFVELVGGGETVTFFNITEKKLTALSKSIIGHKIAPPGMKQKVKIYKAHECVLLKDNFKGNKAKRVDAKIAR
jgi:hypothetical protein